MTYMFPTVCAYNTTNIHLQMSVVYILLLKNFTEMELKLHFGVRKSEICVRCFITQFPCSFVRSLECMEFEFGVVGYQRRLFKKMFKSQSYRGVWDRDRDGADSRGFPSAG